ncbi:MAG TPA: PAS domain-containing protein, partial [Flavisolibacter sp.]|nr:PAS domain-containing protein [Flavisolibacter sp.]
MITVDERPCASFTVDADKLLQAIVDVVCVIDLNGIFRYVSPACKQLFGYEPDEMTDSSFLKFIHPDDIEKTVQLVAERTPDCKTSNFENRYIRKDGSVVPVLWSGRWDENDHLLYCVARNGSEKSELEDRLLKAQQIARVANYEYDFTTGTYTNLSDTFFEIFGICREQNIPFTSQDYLDMIHPDDLKMVQDHLWHPGQLYHANLEYRIV